MANTGLATPVFWVNDLEKMRDTRVLGLTVTDEDEELGIVFGFAQPEQDRHEFVLRRGRTAPDAVKLTHQWSGLGVEGAMPGLLSFTNTKVLHTIRGRSPRETALRQS